MFRGATVSVPVRPFREYHPTGELKKEHGARAYPVEYAYDYAGRMKTMATWKGYAADSGRANTTWNYNNQRGWLQSKQYNDGKGPSYQYTPAGRLLQRTWARGITTSYSNDAAGRLMSIGYSDGTPAVGCSYDRAGHALSVSNSNAAYGYRYDARGRLLDETNSMIPAVVSRGYDARGRPSGVALATDCRVDYGYEAAGRFGSVTATIASGGRGTGKLWRHSGRNRRRCKRPGCEQPACRMTMPSGAQSQTRHCFSIP